MRALLCGLVLMLWPIPAYAQTQAVGTETLAWDQAGDALATVQSHTYLWADGTAAPTPLAGVTCAGTASPYRCSARLPALTTGLHALTLAARAVINGQTLTSTPSAPLSLLIVAVPAVPQNLRVQ